MRTDPGKTMPSISQESANGRYVDERFGSRPMEYKVLTYSIVLHIDPDMSMIYRYPKSNTQNAK